MLKFVNEEMSMEYELQQRRWELENENMNMKHKLQQRIKWELGWENEHDGMITRCYGWWTSKLK